MTHNAVSRTTEFVYESLPTRVIFGSGTLNNVEQEAKRLGMSRILLLCGEPHQNVTSSIAKCLGDIYGATFLGARMHTPVNVTEEAMALVKTSQIDGIVSIGGGSTTGLSKAIALRTDLPQIILPTTYAGSEMTPILGETDNGIKTTQRSPKVLPETVIYDVDLTLDLPPAIAGVSGMNAVAHAVEALYSRDANPVISALAIESIAALLRSLPRIRNEMHDLGARSDALYGAWLAGLCLGSVGMALHHKLCHTLGGTFDLPHAETHAALLPHVLAYNSPAIPEVMKRLSHSLGVDDPALHLYRVNQAIGATPALADIGMPEDGIERAADLALANPYWNPRPLERNAIRNLLARAYRGDEPKP